MEAALTFSLSPALYGNILLWIDLSVIPWNDLFTQLGIDLWWWSLSLYLWFKFGQCVRSWWQCT